MQTVSTEVSVDKSRYITAASEKSASREGEAPYRTVAETVLPDMLGSSSFFKNTTLNTPTQIQPESKTKRICFFANTVFKQPPYIFSKYAIR